MYDQYFPEETIATLTGLPRARLAKYREMKLIGPARVTDDGGLLYPVSTVETVRFIAGASEAGLDMDEIRGFIAIVEVLGDGLEYLECIIAEKVLALREDYGALIAQERKLIEFERECRKRTAMGEPVGFDPALSRSRVLM